MNSREILVANTKTQRKYSVVTDASNLGELKVALDNAGIDYAGMSFTEGISAVTLLKDDSPLPESIEYHGTMKNPVILLTNTKDKVASGAMPRKELYQIIKENGLAERINVYFGRNYTQVSSENLEDYLEHTVLEKDDEDSDECLCDDEEDNEVSYEETTSKTLMNCCYDLIKNLVKREVITLDDFQDLIDLLDEFEARFLEETAGTSCEKGFTPQSENSLSNDELDDLIAGF